VKRVFGMLALALLLLQAPAEAQKLFGAPFLTIPAWTEHTVVTRYPASGTYDVGQWHYIGGMIGIDHFGPHSRGTVTFFWTADAAGTQIVGVRSLPLSSAIPSTNQIRTMNLGPYLYLTYQPWFRSNMPGGVDLVGPHRMAATLFGTDTGLPMTGSDTRLDIQAPPGDNILIDEQGRKMTWREAIYPAGYYGGAVLLYFVAPPGVRAVVYGFDLEDKWWPIDSLPGSGTIRTVVPNGTWFVYVYDDYYGTTGREIEYTLAVTPLFGADGALSGEKR
jgi:hypothetical protein